VAPRGRPQLTEQIVQERIAGYCSRYGVKDFNEAGFPAYPAGKRETRQHREWVVLFRAWSRLRGRTASPGHADRAAALRAQKGVCPICLKSVSLTDATEAPPSAAGETALVHRPCNEALRLVANVGPTVIDRLKAYLWPAVPVASEGRKGAKID